MVEKHKVFCRECDWRGMFDAVEYVQDPKMADNGWSICPNCRSAESIGCICDEWGCGKEATCGTPSPEGYRNVCGTHFRELRKLAK